MTPHLHKGLRVLVSASSFADADAALRLIQRLPDTFQAGLGGVLIEEIDTLAICQIPDQRVVLLNGTTTLAPSVSQVHTLMKADARAFRRLLSLTADPTRTEWFFSQDKGDLITAALRASSGWDILVIGHRRVHKIPGKVVRLQGASVASDGLSEASNQLANQLDADQVAFVVSTSGDNIQRPLDPDAHHFATLDLALQALTRTNAQAVLIDLNQGPVRTPQDLTGLLNAARCPVLVFGASNMATTLEHNTHIPPKPDEEAR